MMCGVMVWNPSGIDLAIIFLSFELPREFSPDEEKKQVNVGGRTALNVGAGVTRLTCSSRKRGVSKDVRASLPRLLQFQDTPPVALQFPSVTWPWGSGVASRGG